MELSYQARRHPAGKAPHFPGMPTVFILFKLSKQQIHYIDGISLRE